MYVRIVRRQPKPGRVDEIAKRWEAIVVPRLRGAPGFRLGYFIGDRQQNTAAGVTVWEQPPDEALIGLGIHAFQEQIQDLTLGPATVEIYEVLVEV